MNQIGYGWNFCWFSAPDITLKLFRMVHECCRKILCIKLAFRSGRPDGKLLCLTESRIPISISLMIIRDLTTISRYFVDFDYISPNDFERLAKVA